MCNYSALHRSLCLAALQTRGVDQRWENSQSWSNTFCMCLCVCVHITFYLVWANSPTALKSDSSIHLHSRFRTRTCFLSIPSSAKTSVNMEHLCKKYHSYNQCTWIQTPTGTLSRAGFPPCMRSFCNIEF